MKRLPVPPLPQTLRRYLDCVALLLDAQAFAATQAAVEEFAAGDGPACQEALLRFADEEHAAGRNWMSEAWLAAYHATRAPLPLTSNATFHLRLDGPAVGLAHAADITHRFAAVHLAYLRGEAEPEVGVRGEPLAGEQWGFLAGGVRDPRPGQDAFLPGPTGAARREVVVLSRGRAAALAVSDEQGRVLHRAALEAGLHRIHRRSPRPSTPFTAPGYLDSDTAAALLAELRQERHNAVVYDRLRDALFVLHLTDEPATLEAHLERSAFHSGQGWPFKPVTLQVSLADDRFVALQIEHSTMDGATIAAMTGRAQQVPAAPDDAAGGAGPSDAPGAAVESLSWVLDAAQEERLARATAAYDESARGHRCRIVTVPTGPTPPLPFRLSHDACQQLVMLYAQLRTYGRLRSTYESVDMREHQAGRTECLRPNTAAAVTFASALVRGEADVGLLRAALHAHREQVKICKSGQAIDRHLFGLRRVARRDGYSMPIVDDPGYRVLTTDFLSTTSLGEQSRVYRVAFAPTSTGGIGVYYTLTDGGYEYFLNADELVCHDIDGFTAALADGTRALWGLIEAASTAAADR